MFQLKLSIALKMESVMLGLGLGLVVIGILLTTVFFVSFRNKFYPGVTIDDIPVGGLTREDAYTILQKYQPREINTVTLAVDDIQLASNSAQLGLKKEYGPVLHEAFKLGRSGFLLGRVFKIWNIENKTYNYSAPFTYNKTQVTTLVNQLKPLVDQPGKLPRATLTYSQTPSSLQINPGLVGREIQVTDTVNQVLLAASNQDVLVSAQIASVGAELTLDQRTQAFDRASRFVDKLVEFQADDQIVRLTDQDLITLLAFPTGTIEEVVQIKVSEWQQQVNRPPQDAVFEYDRTTLQVSKFQPDRNGLEVDLPKTMRQVKDFISMVDNFDPQLDQDEQNNYRYDLAVKQAEPDVPLAKTNNLGINERIGFGDSLYAHSIPSRVHNVAHATQLINNTLIAPGEEFSFVKTLGEVSSKTGFKPAYVILGNETVLGDGGGVCQVSTTTFRAALDAGFNITRRLPHSYRVSYYELNKKPGIDATVYTGEVDLRFINDTGHYVLLTGHTDSENLSMYIEFYGTSDGRTTQIVDHKTWGYTPPPPAQYITDPNLPSGSTKKVENAIAGVKASFKNIVRDKDGNIISEKEYFSNYRPWGAKYLVGP